MRMTSFYQTSLAHSNRGKTRPVRRRALRREQRQRRGPLPLRPQHRIDRFFGAFNASRLSSASSPFWCGVFESPPQGDKRQGKFPHHCQREHDGASSRGCRRGNQGRGLCYRLGWRARGHGQESEIAASWQRSPPVHFKGPPARPYGRVIKREHCDSAHWQPRDSAL